MADDKQLAGYHAADMVDDGMIVGLGTGSTAFFAVRRLGERVRDGLRIQGIPTSEQTRRHAEESGIHLISLDETTRLDMTIDGADEIDPAFEMIKGGGGALLREKIVATASDRVVTIVGGAKCVDVLGAFPLPVEVVPFGWRVVAERLAALGCTPTLRTREDERSEPRAMRAARGVGTPAALPTGRGARGAPLGGEAFVTDNDNYILDCPFGSISDPAELERRIDALPGVVVCGLFVGIADTVVVGRGGEVEVRHRDS